MGLQKTNSQEERLPLDFSKCIDCLRGDLAVYIRFVFRGGTFRHRGPPSAVLRECVVSEVADAFEGVRDRPRVRILGVIVVVEDLSNALGKVAVVLEVLGQRDNVRQRGAEVCVRRSHT